MDATGHPNDREVIVVAEDDPSMAALLEYHLTKSGYDVVLASDGRRALDAVITRRPRLCLLDVSMPEIPGTDVLRMLKTDERTADTPVVLLSGDDQASAIDQAYQLGADDYLVKPVEAQRLLECIETHLRSTKQEKTPQNDPRGSIVEQSETIPNTSEDHVGATTPTGTPRSDPATISHGVQVIDLRTLLDWTHNDMAYVRAAVEDFIGQASDRVRAIASAHEGGDVKRVAYLTHQYQGVLVSFGAMQAAATTRMITDAARRDAGELLPSLIEALREHVTEAVTALRHWQETNAGQNSDPTTGQSSSTRHSAT